MSGRRLAPVLALLLLVLTGLELRRAGRLWRADLLIAAAERDSYRANAVAGGARARLAQRNLERLRRAGELAPVDVQVPLLEGGQQMLLGRPRAAVRAYQRALEIEPRAEVYLNLGHAHHVLGESREAEQVWRTALILNPQLQKQLRGLMNPRKPEKKP